MTDITNSIVPHGWPLTSCGIAGKKTLGIQSAILTPLKCKKSGFDYFAALWERVPVLFGDTEDGYGSLNDVLGMSHCLILSSIECLPLALYAGCPLPVPLFRFPWTEICASSLNSE